MAENIAASVLIKIAANTAQLNTALRSAESNLKDFSSGVTKIAGAIGVSFGIQQVASFAFEVSKLAGEAEGVTAAFERLPNSIALMGQLKEATSGTVSELDLMKRTVQAANFGIALESLPELLKFAAIRAQQTGQSVDYLVDSIITGIGRKSPLILDNLGISAVRLKEQFNGASLEAQNIGDVAKAVGRIATEELTKMGDFSENTSSKIQRLSASWDNLKVSIGKVVNSGGFFADVLDAIDTLLSQSSKNDDPLNKFLLAQTGLAQGIKNESIPAITRYTDELKKLNAEFGLVSDDTKVLNQARAFKLSDEQAARFFNTMKGINGELQNIPKITFDPGALKPQINTLESLQEKLKELNDQFVDIDATDKAKLANIGREIISTQSLIDQLEKYRRKEKEANAEKKRSIDLDSLRVTGLLATAQAFNEAQEAIKKTGEEIGKFIDAINPVATLPEKLDIGPGMRKFIDSLKTTGEEIQGEFIDINSAVENGIAGIADALGRSLGEGNFKNFGRNLLEAVASFAQQLGGLMIASGVAIKFLKSGNPAAMIIGGAALVAAGAAIKATLSRTKNFPNPSSSGGGSSSSPTAVTSFNNSGRTDRIDFNAKFEIEGNKLVAVVNNTNQQNGRLRG